MHDPGLHPTLKPAPALLEPGEESCRGLLVGGGGDHGAHIAKARESHSEIGVFGQIVRIPAADRPQHGGAEVIRRPAERQRQAEARKAGKEHVKQTRIFGGEHAGEPVVLGIVDRELRLHAGKPFVMRQEALKRAPQLVGFRPVFGVEDCDERAARERQGNIERLGLGAGPDGRCDHELVGRAEPHRLQGSAGRVIVRLQDELDVELFRQSSAFRQAMSCLIAATSR
jgi:hypothetical protein